MLPQEREMNEELQSKAGIKYLNQEHWIVSESVGG